jgi:hypothetical protein
MSISPTLLGSALLGAARLTVLDPSSVLDRRKSIRFPINMEAHVKSIRGARQRLDAAGKTINVSSGGALIMTETPVPRGAIVEAHVKWPAALDNCDLKLVLTGQVVWVAGPLVAIERKTHEFRTVARKS